MKVKFLETKHTMNYGLVVAGDVIKVHIDDGIAFINNKVAVEVKKVNKGDK